MYEVSKPPPYASMVMMEIFHDKNTKKHEVRFLFRNRTLPAGISDPLQIGDILEDDNETRPYVKHLLGKCGEFCSIEDFEHLTSDLRLSQKDWMQECNLVQDPVIQVKYVFTIKCCKISYK